jgi:hypothetical protein
MTNRVADAAANTHTAMPRTALYAEIHRPLISSWQKYL